MVDTLRCYFRENKEEKSFDRWLPILGGVVFFAGIAVSVLDIIVLQKSFRPTLFCFVGVVPLLAR